MINPKTKEEDDRYPYTYACDLIRSWGGYSGNGTKLSRADASIIRENLARIIGMPDTTLAEKLARYYVWNEDAITNKSVQDFQQAQEDSKR